MDNNKEKLSVSMVYDEAQTIPLALHETHMARADRRLKYVVTGFTAALIFTVAAFVFLWLQYDYSSTVESTGVYNLVDSQGNVISADISPEDVIRILQELEHGKDTGNQNS